MEGLTMGLDGEWNNKCTLDISTLDIVIPHNILLEIINLQCCDNCHLVSGFPSKFQSTLTILHYTNAPNIVSMISIQTSILRDNRHTKYGISCHQV